MTARLPEHHGGRDEPGESPCQFKAVPPQGRDLPGYTDFIVKLTAMALRDHPRDACPLGKTIAS